MNKVIFSKFCCHRRKKYQIETMIIQEDVNREVVKRAIYPEAAAHIGRLMENENLLRVLYKKNHLIEVVKCYERDENSVGFDFIEGANLADIMEAIFEEGDVEEIINSLELFYDLLLPMATKKSWKITDEFRKVFGETVFHNDLISGDICNIDMIFSNIIKSEIYYITDYEWVFQFPIPINYIFYRSLLLSCGFSKLKNEIKLQVWKKFGIDQYQQDVYLEMEKKLQYYIVGEEFSVRCLNNKNLYKTVDFNSVPWENSGYIVRIYSIDENERKELYSRINFDNQIKVDLDLREYYSVKQLAFSLGSGNSIVIINRVIGVVGGCEVILEYAHNAELQINDNLYFTKSEPLLYIRNKQYDSIILEYQICKSNDSMVKTIVDYIQERQQFKEKAEFLSEYVEQLEKRNEDLRKELLQVGDERSELLKNLLEMGDERSELVKKLLKLGDENYLLKADNEYLRNLKVVKAYQKLKGKQ